MGTSFVIKDHDKIYKEQLIVPPVLLDYQQLAQHEYFNKALSKRHREALANSAKPRTVNLMKDSTYEDKEKINKMFYTRYISERSNSVIEDIPSCVCGDFNTYKNLDCICSNCGTPVLSNRGTNLHSLVWITAPKGIPAMINPTIYRMLRERFTISKFNVIRWILDYSYTGPGKEPPIVAQLEYRGVPRGLINFYNHFDEIIEMLFSIRTPNKGSDPNSDEVLRQLLKDNREKIFPKNIPFPNKVLLVVESNNFATYMDPKLAGIIDALWLMVGIDSELSNLTLKQKEARVVKAIEQIADYNQETDKGTFSKKGGIFRRHIFGFRTWMSFRTVVSSITEPHHYRDIYIPWHVGMTVLHYHLVNKLSKRINPDTGVRYTPHEIDRFIEGHVNRFHPIFRELFDEILAETPNGRGIACMKNRNPSLYRNSIQLVYITKIKDDVTDVTTSISILTVVPLNAKIIVIHSYRNSYKELSVDVNKSFTEFV